MKSVNVRHSKPQFRPHMVETAPACDSYLSSAGLCVAESTGWLTDGVDMRRQRPQRAAPVLLDGFWGVELGDVVVGVHRDQDVGHERLDEEEKRSKRQQQPGGAPSASLKEPL